MKEIKIIIQPFKLSLVTDALQALPGIGGITAIEVRGFGHQRGHSGVEERASGSVNFVPKVMILLVVPDALVDPVLDAVRRHAHTGNPGDGKAFVSPVEDALRIRDGQRGDLAL